jgi:hypothetical protein
MSSKPTCRKKEGDGVGMREEVRRRWELEGGGSQKVNRWVGHDDDGERKKSPD